MRINKIHIRDFRGIQDLELELNPHFNLLIGPNGAGKTAILEALNVAIGSFFSGMPGVKGRHIRTNDIRYFRTIEGTYEYAIKTRVHVVDAFLEGQSISWYKERNGITGSNVMGNRSQIRLISEELNQSIKNSNRTVFVNLPILAYYSTARLWREGRDNKKGEEKEKKIRNLPSRYRGYKDALEIKSSFKIMLDWFKSHFQDVAVNKTRSPKLECVRTVIVNNIPGAKDIKWVFNQDEIQTLYIEFQNQTEIPFDFLSDGYRNLLAIFADIAYRCATLNPHYGIEANLKCSGVVLIDELDLHLHPAWQKVIIDQLKNTFPKIQFVATTHSPFIIQSTKEGELFKLKIDESLMVSGADELSLEDVAEFVQDVPDPAWSQKKKQMYDSAKEYFDLLTRMTPDTNPNELNVIREKLNLLGKAYSDNVAYTAFLEQKRFLTEQKLNT